MKTVYTHFSFLFLLAGLSAHAQNITTTEDAFSSFSTTSTPENNTTSDGSGVVPAFSIGEYMGTPSYAGSGCPFGSVSTSMSPDDTAVTVLFDDYIVRAGGIYANQNYMTCRITIPLYVPHGYQIGIIRTDYRGFNDLPFGAQSQFKVEYFLAGETTRSYTEVYDGPFLEDFLLQDTVNTQNVVWSRCSYPTNFNIDTKLAVFSNFNNDEASISLDSADVTINDPTGPKGLQFYFVRKPCVTSSANTAEISHSLLVLLGLLTSVQLFLN